MLRCVVHVLGRAVQLVVWVGVQIIVTLLMVVLNVLPVHLSPHGVPSAQPFPVRDNSKLHELSVCINTINNKYLPMDTREGPNSALSHSLGDERVRRRERVPGERVLHAVRCVP